MTMDETDAIREGLEALSKIPVSALPRFDAALRDSSPYGSSWLALFARLSPAAVPRLARFSRDRDRVGILLASHRSGWVREAALPLLTQYVTPHSVGMLVVRSGDWVHQVSETAQALLRNVVATHGVDVLVPALPILEQLATEQSRSGPYAREMFDDAVSRLSTAAVASGLRSPDRRVRRSLARMLASRADALAALDAALGQDDAVTLNLAAQAACAGDGSLELAERLWATRVPRVRALALTRLLSGPSDTAVAAAERALLDPNGYVRSLAQTHLRARGIDVADRYAATLTASPLPPTSTQAALRGLGETRAHAHRALVTSFARHPSARVRETVCRVIRDLGADDHRELLVELTGDRSRRVAACAGQVLVSLGLSGADQERLWRSCLARADEALLPALMGLDRWRQLTLACRAIGSNDPRAMEHGHALLDHVMVTWNSSFTAPSPAFRAELAKTLDAALAVLDAERARELRLQLRPFLPNL